MVILIYWILCILFLFYIKIYFCYRMFCVMIFFRYEKLVVFFMFFMKNVIFLWWCFEMYLSLLIIFWVFKILFYFGGGIKVKINNFKFGIFMYENILRLFFSFINLYKKKRYRKEV